MSYLVNDVFPAGIVLPYAGATAPDGWRFCNGDAISRTTFARLFAAISTTYGAGDTTTTFNLPNTQGVFLRGAGSRTISSVTYTGTIGASQGDQVQGHFHSKSETAHGHAITEPNSGQGHRHGITVGNNIAAGTLVHERSTNLAGGGPVTDYATTGITIVGSNSNVAITSPTTDGANGTPRTGTQTHPANLGVNYIIKL